METFPIVKRKDEKLYGGEYCTRRLILEVYEEMRKEMETEEAYRTRLVPVPGDRAMAHEPKEIANIQI